MARGRPTVYGDCVSKHISVQVKDLEFFETAALAHNMSFSEYANTAMEFLAVSKKSQELIREFQRTKRWTIEKEEREARAAKKAQRSK